MSASWAWPVSFYSYRADSKTRTHSLKEHKVQRGVDSYPWPTGTSKTTPQLQGCFEFELPDSYGSIPLVSSSRPSRQIPAASCWTIGSHVGIIVLGSKIFATYLCFYPEMNDVCGLCGSREALFQLLAILGPMRTH